MPEQFRRTDPRYDRRLPIEVIHAGARLEMNSRNISLGGIYLETDVVLPVGTTVQIRFRVPSQSEAIEVAGDVRWTDAAGPSGTGGMGIRFHGLRARDVWALNRFFQS